MRNDIPLGIICLALRKNNAKIVPFFLVIKGFRIRDRLGKNSWTATSEASPGDPPMVREGVAGHRLGCCATENIASVRGCRLSRDRLAPAHWVLRFAAWAKPIAGQIIAVQIAWNRFTQP
jgi:hypothetical protein